MELHPSPPAHVAPPTRPAGSGAPWDRARVPRPASRGQRPRPRLDREVGRPAPGDARGRPSHPHPVPGAHPGRTSVTVLRRYARPRAPQPPTPLRTVIIEALPRGPSTGVGGPGNGPGDRAGAGGRSGGRRKWTVPKCAESVAEQALRPARCCVEAVLPAAGRRPVEASTDAAERSGGNDFHLTLRERRSGADLRADPPRRERARPALPATHAGAVRARPRSRPTRRRSSPGAVTPAPAQP